MFIKCWGSRGSIPVSGKKYVTFGGDTTCFEIRANSGEIVIIDAGTGLRRLGKSLVRRKKHTYYMLLTHCHWDHILGIAFFSPLLYSRNRLIIQDRTFAGYSTKEVFDQVMRPPFFPVRVKDLYADIRYDKRLNGKFSIGSLDIETIPTSHSEGSVGYKFTEGGKTFVFLTDNELGFDHPQSKGADGYRKFAQDADILFHDADYTNEEYRVRTGWGHSSVSQVLNLALKANVGQLGLIHLNQDRSDDEMDDIVADCNRFFRRHNSRTTCYGVPYNFEITL